MKANLIGQTSLMSSTNLKKPEVVILIPPKLDRVISQDFVHSAATNLYVAFQ